MQCCGVPLLFKHQHTKERNMNTAANIQALADGGYISQAIAMCESESVSVMDYEGGNDYLFSDGSCVHVENRTVTTVEAEQAGF